MKSLLTIITIVCSSISLSAQDLSFTVSIVSDKNKDPMIMKVAASGTKMVMEPQQMTPQGTMKFLVDNTTSKQYMLVDANGQKMAMAFDMNDFGKTNESKTPPKITITKETRTVDGYKCTKVIAETDDQLTDMWTTEAVGMQYADFSKMMASAQKQNPYASVPELKNMKGFPVEIVTTDKKSKSVTTINIRDISKAPVSPEVFSMKGYQVMDVPAKTK